ncbi:MAG: Holliday junction resolvase RuvX [Arenicella sp.]
MINTVISFDYGTKKTGVAVGQTLTRTARSLTTIKTVNAMPEPTLLDKTIQEWQPNLAIIGRPPNANDTFLRKLERLSQLLEKRYQLQSLFIDETLTTEQANYELHQQGVKRNNKAAQRDQIAARLILETYFETLT